MQTETFTSLLSMVIGLRIGTAMKEGGMDFLNQEFHPAGDLRQERGGTSGLETPKRVSQLGEFLTILLHLRTKESIGFGCTLQRV